LRQQSAALGFKGNNELRAALRAALGRAEYDALIAQARAARAAARSTGAAT
jgi:hypothetical protein